ncbi:MAG: hypothetical protein HC818_02825 [Synechococcaceae cyanobacterium RM1_1_27]|nr:hypothetical protein [Synechococcaceae cyanobacterium RM1_1_27]
MRGKRCGTHFGIVVGKPVRYRTGRCNIGQQGCDTTASRPLDHNQTVLLGLQNSINFDQDGPLPRQATRPGNNELRLSIHAFSDCI